MPEIEKISIIVSKTKREISLAENVIILCWAVIFIHQVVYSSNLFKPLSEKKKEADIAASPPPTFYFVVN